MLFKCLLFFFFRTTTLYYGVGGQLISRHSPTLATLGVVGAASGSAVGGEAGAAAVVAQLP